MGATTDDARGRFVSSPRAGSRRRATVAAAGGEVDDPSPISRLPAAHTRQLFPARGASGNERAAAPAFAVAETVRAAGVSTGAARADLGSGRWIRGRSIAPPEPLDGPDEIGTPAELQRHGQRRLLLEWTAVLGGALVVALLVKVLLLQAFVIPTGSMIPTLGIGDRVLVNKLSYRDGNFDRGDVVVFERPPAAIDPNDDSDLIKRVIGLPGESVAGRDNVVYIDGEPLAEPWLPPGTFTNDFGPIEVPEGALFLMGDNRAHSTDGRAFGPVPITLVVGRAMFRVWPPSHLGGL